MQYAEVCTQRHDVVTIRSEPLSVHTHCLYGVNESTSAAKKHVAVRVPLDVTGDTINPLTIDATKAKFIIINPRILASACGRVKISGCMEAASIPGHL